MRLNSYSLKYRMTHQNNLTEDEIVTIVYCWMLRSQPDTKGYEWSLREISVLMGINYCTTKTIFRRSILKLRANKDKLFQSVTLGDIITLGAYGAIIIFTWLKFKASLQISMKRMDTEYTLRLKVIEKDIADLKLKILEVEKECKQDTKELERKI